MPLKGERMQNLESDIRKLLNNLQNVTHNDDLESIRIKVAGKNGFLNQGFKMVAQAENKNKKDIAKKINELKAEFERNYKIKKEEIDLKELNSQLKNEKIDVSLFNPNVQSFGHPVYRMQDMIIEYFTSLNFSLHEGPFIEDDFHNFEALNLPKFHPARDMQDTFYFSDSMLLRTHTSPVQIRTMENFSPPIRMICTGATFRRDYDLTHSPMFHQCEGLLVEKGDKMSFANLKFLLEDFLHYIFGDNIKIRFRPSFFPFTEPSAEVDISCIFCAGNGCRVCSNTGFLEVLGCGVVNPKVFKFVNYEEVSGYAFGVGVERLAMLKWGINDLRSFYETDLRLLEQF